LPIVEPITLQEALAFSVIALVLGPIIIRWRPDLGRSVSVTLVMILAGLGGLAVLSHFDIDPLRKSLALVPREISLLLVALGIIRVLISFVVNVLLAKRAVPRILGEVAIVISLVVFALVRMDAVGVNLASIITTSAVLTGVIAFSLQATLGNLWGGISLQLDNTCRIGDWIEIDGVTGEVVSIRWRYTALATVSNVTIIIPNQALVTNRVTLLGRRGDQRIPWRRGVEFEVGYEWTPGQVLEVINAAFKGVEIPCVAGDPTPFCVCAGFDAPAVKYIVYYWCTDIRAYLPTDSRVRVHLFAALGRARMEIPISRSDLFLHSGRSVRNNAATREQDARVALLGSLELFAPLTEDERQRLAAQLRPMPFAPGEAIIRQDEQAESLYVLSRGNIDVYNETPGSPRQRLASVKAPAFVGEMGLLTGQPRRATVLAASEVLCYRLDKGDFEAILSARPELVEALSQTVAAREAANSATLASLSAEARAQATGTRANEIVRRIKQFFGL
jgi:small-conductance mechanosensitive channel/CRP-like cAMP-binding protein